MSAKELQEYEGQPAWKLAMLLDAALIEERATDLYGNSMASNLDIKNASPQNLDGLLQVIQLRTKKMTLDTIDHLVADAS